METYQKQKDKWLNYICITLTILVLVVFLFQHFNCSNIFDSFRIGFVMSESMEPTIPIHSLLIEKKLLLTDEVHEQDIVTFPFQNLNNEKILITHRIVRIEDGFIYTKGDNNIYEDSDVKTRDDLLYKVHVIIPHFLDILCFLGIIIFLLRLFRINVLKFKNN